MKYRIKQIKMADDKSIFIPQRKIMDLFWMSFIGILPDLEIFNFRSLKEAKEYINNRKKRALKNKVVEETIHPL